MAAAPDPRLVFSKTPRGQDEVAQRVPGLSIFARRILILVDGRRSLRDLAPFARPGEIEHIVDDLQARGLIVLSGIADALTDEEIAEQARRERQALEGLQRALDGVFARELGAEGLVLDARVRDCVNLDLMRRLLREALDAVARERGPRAIEPLLRTIRAHYARYANRAGGR